MKRSDPFILIFLGSCLWIGCNQTQSPGGATNSSQSNQRQPCDGNNCEESAKHVKPVNPSSQAGPTGNAKPGRQADRRR
jgi:hypothetical protein